MDFDNSRYLLLENRCGHHESEEKPKVVFFDLGCTEFAKGPCPRRVCREPWTPKVLFLRVLFSANCIRVVSNFIGRWTSIAQFCAPLVRNSEDGPLRGLRRGALDPALLQLVSRPLPGVRRDLRLGGQAHGRGPVVGPRARLLKAQAPLLQPTGRGALGETKGPRR